MVRKPTDLRSTIEEKQKKHEAEMQVLLQKRKEHILTLIEKTDCLYIEDDLLVGALLFLKENSNKDTTTADEETTTDNFAVSLFMEWKENATAFFQGKAPKASAKRAATHKRKAHISA